MIMKKFKIMIAGLLVIVSLGIVGCDNTEEVTSDDFTTSEEGHSNAVEYAKEDLAEYENEGKIKISDIVYRMEEIIFDEGNELDTDTYVDEILKSIKFEGMRTEDVRATILEDYRYRASIRLAEEDLSQAFSKYNCRVTLTPVNGVENVYTGSIMNNETGECVGEITHYDTTNGEYRYVFYKN